MMYGNRKSLIDRRHRPHSNPAQHTEQENKLIKRYYRRNKEDKLVLWDKLREHGYTRCCKSMLRASKRIGFEMTPEQRRGYKPKPYQRAEYPGQKEKLVPEYCIVNGQKYYQYTAINEYTHCCFIEMYDEHNTYSSLDFSEKLIAYFSFPVREIQTDNGTEWASALSVKTATHKTLFEQYLEDGEIKYHRIRATTPGCNVERWHNV